MSAFEIVQIIIGLGMYSIAIITLSIKLQDKKNNQQ